MASAVLYCRVASGTHEGVKVALREQEARCRDYARQAGLDVVGVFRDHAAAIDAARPGLNAMLSRLRQNPGSGLVVISDDVDRLARGPLLLQQIQAEIAQAGAILAWSAAAPPVGRSAG